MTNGEDAGNMLDIRPSRTLPEWHPRHSQLPAADRGGQTRIDHLDRCDCFSEANDLIAQFKAGKLTERDAENAIRELAYGCAAKK
jgi:hypothetical protein